MDELGELAPRLANGGRASHLRPGPPAAAVRILSPRLLGTRALTRRAGALVSGGADSDRDVVAAARRIDTPPHSPTSRTSSASRRAIWAWFGWRVAPGTTLGGSSGAIGAGVTAGGHVSLGVVPKVASMCSRQRAFSRWSPPMARHQPGGRGGGACVVSGAILGRVLRCRAQRGRRGAPSSWWCG